MSQVHQQIGPELWKELLEDPRWFERRSDYLRSHSTCDSCGVYSKLEVHHIVYRPSLLPWAYLDEDLRALCRSCHDKLQTARRHLVRLALNLSPEVNDKLVWLCIEIARANNNQAAVSAIEAATRSITNARHTDASQPRTAAAQGNVVNAIHRLGAEYGFLG